MLEINGPTHYIFESYYDHKTVIRAGLLRDLGYKPVFIKYDSWYAIKGDSEKRRYLMDAFEKAIRLEDI